jgi:hypothetical protein
MKLLFLIGLFLISSENNMERKESMLTIHFPKSYNPTDMIKTNNKIYLIAKINNSKENPIRMINFNNRFVLDEEISQEKKYGIFIELMDSSGKKIPHIYVHDDLPPFKELLEKKGNQKQPEPKKSTQRKEQQSKIENELVVPGNNSIYDIIDISWIKYHVDTLVKLKIYITISDVEDPTENNFEMLGSNELTLDLRR